jgi:hypothetical protein
MQIGAYVIILTTSSSTIAGGGRTQENMNFINQILDKYFCPIFTAHGPTNSYSVCEDKVSQCINTGKIIFTNYERFIQSPYNMMCGVVIQEFGDISDIQKMIDNIVKFIDSTNQGPVLYDA